MTLQSGSRTPGSSEMKSPVAGVLAAVQAAAVKVGMVISLTEADTYEFMYALASAKQADSAERMR